MGSNPPTFKKGTHVIIANPKIRRLFLGGRVEGEEARAVSNCVKQTEISNMPCYYIEFNVDHLFISCGDQCQS